MSQRILVVEDQEDVRAILRDYLSASGYAVIEAADGAESVAKAASERPDLVLMDIQLPVLDGYDATRQIKALPGLAAIPIIAGSSFAMKGDEEKARASGCDDYVTKPYSPVDLLRLVRRYLGENAPQKDAMGGRRPALVCQQSPSSKVVVGLQGDYRNGSREYSHIAGG